MKDLYLSLILIIGIATTTQSQGVNQITIFPSNPTANDSISVISNLSYYGNCTYGLVHSYSYLADSIIYITPTYCGYGDTTFCNSIDTFEIGTFLAGNYIISIDYHQGSVCPVSGFDATIAHFDTMLTVSGTSASYPLNIKNGLINIYPNPADGYITIDIGLVVPMTSDQLIITNLAGQRVLQRSIHQRQFNADLSALPGKGIYLVSVMDGLGNTLVIRKMAKL